jgi:FKBP-type peptidyl-prolyl cis-trans isomerase
MKMNKLAIALVAALAAPVAAQAPEAKAPERDADYHNRQMLYLYNLKPSEGWMQTASGLRYRKVKEATADRRPSPTDTVTIHYVGRFIDGTEFDSSVARGEPATFPLPRLIKGWQEGVPLMEVGDTFELAIPWHLAYGAEGRGKIPGGATLLFTIDLVDVPAQQ